MADGFHKGLPAQVDIPTLGVWQTVQYSRGSRKESKTDHRSRSRTPIRDSTNNHSDSPPTKKQHVQGDTGNESDNADVMITEETSGTTTPLHSFLLSNFDAKFQNAKHILQQLCKYVPRQNVTQIIPTRNGMIIKSPDAQLATTIRNKFSVEIFGKSATFINLNSQRIKQTPPPRKPPLLSVVICGVDPTWSEEEIAEELRQEEYEITKVLRIKCQSGPSHFDSHFHLSFPRCFTGFGHRTD